MILHVRDCRLNFISLNNKDKSCQFLERFHDILQSFFFAPSVELCTPSGTSSLLVHCEILTCELPHRINRGVVPL